MLTRNLLLHLFFPDDSLVFRHSHDDEDTDQGSDVGLLCFGKCEVEEL